MDRISTNLWALFSIIPALLIAGLLYKESDIHRYRLLSVPTNTATITLTPSITPSTTPSLTTTPTATVVPTQTPYPTYTPFPTQTARKTIRRQALITYVQGVDKNITVESKILVKLDYQIGKDVYFTKGDFIVSAGVDNSKIRTNTITTETFAEGSIITVVLPDTEFIGYPNPVYETGTPGIYGKKSLAEWYEFGEKLWPNLPQFEDASKVQDAQRDYALARACEYHLLEYAADNARVQWTAKIRNFPGVGKFDRIDVIVKPGTCTK